MKDIRKLPVGSNTKDSRTEGMTGWNARVKDGKQEVSCCRLTSPKYLYTIRVVLGSTAITTQYNWYILSRTRRECRVADHI